MTDIASGEAVDALLEQNRATLDEAMAAIGVCGTCRPRSLERQVRMDFQYALEQSELDRGFVLARQAHPISDAVALDFD